MKRILNAFVGLSLLLAGCSDGNDYVNALPKNAAMVAAVDASAMAQKSGINAEKNASAKEQLKQLVKGTVNGAPELVDALFEDANESGIDFGADVYGFASSGMATYGFVAKTDDSGKLEEMLKTLNRQGVCGNIEDTDGARYTVLANWLLAYSDKAVVALTDAKDPDARKLVRRASMMIRQEDGEGFASTADFKELDNSKSDMSVWLSMDMIPREVVRPLTMGASGEMDLKDVKSIAHIDFEQGKTVVGFKTLLADKYVSGLVAESQMASNDIAGRLAADFPANTPIWFNASLNGKELFDLIQKVPMARMYFEKSMLPLDFKEIFGAMKGDCVLAVTDVARKFFILESEVKDKTFMKAFEELKPLMKLTNGQAVLNSVGADEYEFITVNASLVGLGSGPAAYWFGVRNGKFYLTNNKNLVDRKVLGLSMADRPFSSEINGNRFYMTVNMSSMRTNQRDKVFLSLLNNNLKPLFGNLDYMTMSVHNDNAHKIEFVMKDKDKNLIEWLLKMLKL